MLAMPWPMKVQVVKVENMGTGTPCTISGWGDTITKRTTTKRKPIVEEKQSMSKHIQLRLFWKYVQTQFKIMVPISFEVAYVGIRDEAPNRAGAERH